MQKVETQTPAWAGLNGNFLLQISAPVNTWFSFPFTTPLRPFFSFQDSSVMTFLPSKCLGMIPFNIHA